MNPSPAAKCFPRFLHLEDNPADAELIQQQLKEAWPDCAIHRVETRAAFGAALQTGAYDLILSDFSLPAFDGLSALALVREADRKLPFVFLSGTIGEDNAVEALKRGAVDYVIKDRPARLIPAIRRALLLVKEAEHRHQLESALRQQQERFRQITENVTDLIIVLDLEGRRVYNNPACRALVRAPEELIGQDVFLSIHPEDRGRMQAAFREILRCGTCPRTEVRYLLESGEARNLEACGNVIRSDAGEMTHVLVVARDVTERRAAEDVLREREQQLSKAQRVAQLGSWDWEAETRRFVWSDELYRILGLVPQAFRPDYASFLQQVHHEDRAFFHQLLRRVVRERQPLNCEIRVLLPDRTVQVLHVQGHAAWDDAGRLVRLSGTAQCITERRRTEQKIREQAELLDKAHDAICVLDLAGGITYWNRSAEELYELSGAEAIGRNGLDLFAPPPATTGREARQAVLEHGEWSGEFRHATRQGEGRVVAGRLTLIRDGGGLPKSILAINTDITERRRIETQLLRSERIDSIGMLAGGVAHDLNNALAPVLMAAELLRMRLSDPADVKMVDSITAGAQHGAALVQQLLAFARGTEGQRTKIEMPVLIEDVTKLLRSTLPRSIELTARMNGLPPPVLGDATKIKQVLINLCLNARDAMPEGGAIALTAENTEVTESQARGHGGGAPGLHLRLEVRDTGSGIPPALLDRIFDPFFTTKPVGKGTGLGLSMVAGIMKSHGGFIEVASQPDQGTAFCLYFPAAVEAEAVLAPEDGYAAKGHGERVLLVEDDPAIRDIFRVLLEKAGYQITLAVDGPTGLRAFQQEVKGFALVITDMVMPGLSGMEVITALRVLRPRQQILAISGMVQSGVPETLSALNPSVEYLPKPILPKVLLATLERLLRPAAGKS